MHNYMKNMSSNKLKPESKPCNYQKSDEIHSTKRFLTKHSRRLEFRNYSCHELDALIGDLNSPLGLKEEGDISPPAGDNSRRTETQDVC